MFGFYERIAPVLVPHLRDRPFTMLRYPDGIAGKHFFQKDAPSHMPLDPTFASVFEHEGTRQKRESPTRSSNDELHCCGWRTWAAST